jgi:hypothetical protein
MQGRSVRKRLLAALAVGVAASALISGCSAPGVFPAILSEPTSRNDTTLSPDQVKDATANLISERDRLCAEANADADRHPAAGTPANCGPANSVLTGSTQTTGASDKP